MAGRFLLYGATGFSGRLIAERARRRGLRPILAGRDARRLRELGTQLGCEHRAVPLDAGGALRSAMRDVDVALNAAGPFAATAPPLVDACLHSRTHYLDLTGEVPVLDALSRRDAPARARGVMLMPAVGFVVVPSDCLSLHVARRLPDACRLRIGVSRTDAVSRGSMKTILEQWSDTVAIRRGGALSAVPLGQLERRFDYGRGACPSAAVSWGDIVTAQHTTGISDIEVYLEVSPSERAMFRLSGRFAPLLESTALREWAKLPMRFLADGPSAERRAGAGRTIVAEAQNAGGQCTRARLNTPDAYAFTADSAVAILERVLDGEVEAGFQTPARMYGADFVLGLDGVVREDLRA
jgi:short subunit dehydrogenase-like uncharacterized protein